MNVLKIAVLNIGLILSTISRGESQYWNIDINEFGPVMCHLNNGVSYYTRLSVPTRISPCTEVHMEELCVTRNGATNYSGTRERLLIVSTLTQKGIQRVLKQETVHLSPSESAQLYAQLDRKKQHEDAYKKDNQESFK